MKNLWIGLSMLCLAAAACAEEKTEETPVTIHGLVVEAGNGWMKVRTNPNDMNPVYRRIRVTPETRYGFGRGDFQLKKRLIDNDDIPFSNTHGKGSIEFDYPVPDGDLWLLAQLRPHRNRQREITGWPVEEALSGSPIPLDVARLSTRPIEAVTPTDEHPWVAGKLIDGSTVQAGDQRIHIETGRDGFHVYGLLTDSADFWKHVRPFAMEIRVVEGSLGSDGKTIVASDLCGWKAWNRAETDDPNLPRVLFIGDSISYNYAGAIYNALRGKVNLHHPPQNCGKIMVGYNNLMGWLGPWDQPGHHWDAVAFNHGHWNDQRPRDWQQNYLKRYIAKLRHAGVGNIIWVNTAPVPAGYKPMPDDFDPTTGEGAPHRRHGVMELAVNPYQIEEIARHEGIFVCDMHRILKESPFSQEWYQNSNNVHLPSTPVKELAGRVLGRTILNVVGMEDVPLNPPLQVNEEDIKEASMGRASLEEYKRFWESGLDAYIIREPTRGDGSVPPGAEHMTYQGAKAATAGESPAPAPARERLYVEDGGTYFVDDEGEAHLLGACSVDYAKIQGPPKQKALQRVLLARKDLLQHEEWYSSGEIPDDQLWLAEQIYEWAVREANPAGHSR